MATITSSGGFKPSTTDTPLDVRTRVNTYAEIKNIQNPYIGMEITVLEDETNNGKKTKYEVIDLLPNETEIPNALININTLKRKIDIYENNGDLIIGDSDDESNPKKLQTKYDDTLSTNNKEIPKAINELKLAIDNVGDGSGGGSGLTTEQSQQLQTAYQHSQSPHITTSDVNTAVQTYVNDNISLLKGDKGDKGEQGLPGIKGDKGANGKDGTNAVNPNFTIGTVTTLPSGSNAKVTLTGTYPNLVLNFEIPRGADGSSGGTDKPIDNTPYMYYGRLSFQDIGGKVIQYNQITEAMIKKGVTDGKLTKTTPKTMGKTSMGVYADTAELDYIIIAVPTSKNYKVTKDNGIGGKMIFDEETAGANGVDITIDNVACKLYGEILLSQGEMFIYVD